MPHRSNSDWDRPVLKKHHDPFFIRIWLLIGGLALLVPLVLILRPTNDDQTGVTADGLPGAVAVIQPGGSDGSAAPVSAEATTTSSPATVPAYSVAPNSVASEATPTVVSTAATAVVVESAAPPTAVAPPTASAPTTTVARTPTTVGCAQSYEVAGGDSWSGIAAGYGIGLSTLLGLNGASIDTPIYPGDEICLPAGAARVATTTTTRPTTTTTAAPRTTTTVARTTAPPTTVAPATTAPGTTAAPATTVPSRSYSYDEIEQIIRDVFPDDLEERALRVAWRESTYNPAARNSCCYGLFQINWNSHRSWLDDFGITSASQLYDPRLNTEVALAVYYRAGGWGPWGG